MSQTFAYELITPERAAEMLAHSHPRQRKAGIKKVAAYTRTMTEGRWNDHVPQPVMVSPDGLLLNGGHRLAAVIATGIPTTLLVAYNVPEDVFDVIDTGSTRQARQFVTGAFPAQRASAARWVMWAERRFDQAPSSVSMAFDLDEVVDFMDMNDDDLQRVVSVAATAMKTSKIPASVHAAVLLLAERGGADPERMASWLDGVTTGANLEEDDPRLALRTWWATPHKDRSSRAVWYVVASALNAHIHGREVDKMQAPRRTTRTWPRVGEHPDDYRRRANASYNTAPGKRRARRASISVSTAIPETSTETMAASS